MTETLLGDAGLLCLSCGIGCWICAVFLPSGPIAAFTACAAFVSAALILLTAGIWAARGAGSALPLLILAAASAAVTVIAVRTGKRRGWD
jgi:hypothetical protein